MKLLSFIVPCYNVEKYIRQCLDSIYSCNLPEDQYEVLCINDCSPDGTQNILEQYQKRHDNLRIIVHEVNKGLGGARNTGVRETRGKYLWFVDSDDLVIAQGLNALVQKTIEQDLDVLCFNYRRVDEAGKEISEHKVFKETSTLEGYSFVKSVFGKGVVFHMGYVVRFLYRTDYLRYHQFSFPEHVRWEDTVFMPKALLNAARVAAVPDVLYSYRVNPDSISGNFAKAYPAQLIYEYAFCAGGDLLRFSEEVRDSELKWAFRDTAVKKYINGFPLHLFRARKTERKKFYTLIKDRKMELKPLKSEINVLGGLLLFPVIGPVLAEMGAVIYRVNHGR